MLLNGYDGLSDTVTSARGNPLSEFYSHVEFGDCMYCTLRLGQCCLFIALENPLQPARLPEGHTVSCSPVGFLDPVATVGLVLHTQCRRSACQQINKPHDGPPPVPNHLEEITISYAQINVITRAGVTH